MNLFITHECLSMQDLLKDWKCDEILAEGIVQIQKELEELNRMSRNKVRTWTSHIIIM